MNKNRLVERGIEFGVGIVLLGLGLKMDSISLKVFLYLMSAMFFLAIFRPAKLT